MLINKPCGDFSRCFFTFPAECSSSPLFMEILDDLRHRFKSRCMRDKLGRSGVKDKIIQGLGWLRWRWQIWLLRHWSSSHGRSAFIGPALDMEFNVLAILCPPWLLTGDQLLVVGGMALPKSLSASDFVICKPKKSVKRQYTWHKLRKLIWRWSSMDGEKDARFPRMFMLEDEEMPSIGCSNRRRMDTHNPDWPVGVLSITPDLP